MSILSKPYFHDEKAAFEFLESVVWADGAVCPHCGCTGNIKNIPANPEKRVRYGLHRCGDCKKQFTVKIGTVFEHMRIPMHKALQAVYLMCASKKGVSAHQLHRTLEVTYKTAWFLAHRIREAMRSGELAPFGSDGGIVEVDETYVGGKTSLAKGKYKRKAPVLTLVDRNTGNARSFHIDRANKATIIPILRDNLVAEARVITDDSPIYRDLDRDYLHAFVVHSKGQYGRGEIHTNTIEGFYSVMKRGLKGVYQHCSKKHLHRYAAEFDFRYSNRAALGCDDQDRTETALTGIVGKRLTYRRTNEGVIG